MRILPLLESVAKESCLWHSTLQPSYALPNWVTFKRNCYYNLWVEFAGKSISAQWKESLCVKATWWQTLDGLRNLWGARSKEGLKGHLSAFLERGFLSWLELMLRLEPLRSLRTVSPPPHTTKSAFATPASLLESGSCRIGHDLRDHLIQPCRDGLRD